MLINARRFLFSPVLLVILLFNLLSDVVHGDDVVREGLHSDIKELLEARPDLVLDVLREHPLELVEILEQAVTVKRQADQRRQEQADLAIERNPAVSLERPIRGNPDASITIVEYSDFLCPYCSQATETIKRLMAGEHAKELRLVFKHLPLNPVSQELALAYEAAALQSHEAAWKLHDRFFERQAQLRGDTAAVLENIVAELGLDPERFAKDRKRPELAELIRKDMEEARSFGFSGTPMFLINGIPLRGAVPLGEFERIVGLAKARLVSEAAKPN